MRVLGIDAAWTVTQPSGVCLINSEDGYKCNLERIASSIYGFINKQEGLFSKPTGQKISLKKILEACKETNVQCIAVDMPLSEKLITGRRSCERSVSKIYGSKSAATHSPNINRSGEISLHLVQEADELGFKLSLLGQVEKDSCMIEVYPHTSIIEYLELDYR